ncbi:MAG TPA: tripartite tricarboxylate transporter substrate binding protein [Burkholderiales bacterium]
MTRDWWLCLLLVALGGSGLAHAQGAFPAKPIRFVVTSPPGGANDTLNRAIGAKLMDLTGQPVVIDNRPGASGFVAAEIVAKAPADGYTVLTGTEATLVTNPLIFPKTPYKTQRDFAPVTMTAAVSHVLLVHPSLPATSVRELIAVAKAKPGQLNYASSGTGSVFHLGMELFKRMAGVDIVHVPFKGSALSIGAMLAGDVQMMLVGTTTGLPLARSGKARALAMASGKRSTLAPELPTIAEAALPGYEISSWFGAVVPSATPAPVVAKLHADFIRALNSPDLRERLAPGGYEVIANTPQQFSAHMAAQSKRLAGIIREAGIKVE